MLHCRGAVVLIFDGLLYYIFGCFFNISFKKKDVGYILVYFTSSLVEFGIFLSKWIINIPGL